MVHQHFMLVPVMTVAENLVLGAEPQQRAAAGLQGGGRRARASCRSASASRSTRTRKVEDLGVGAQQRVEILRALFRGAKVLVLDEPTAVLTAQEAQDLFGVLRALKADGTSVVFISHKLNEVLDVADRVTVLRRGEKIDTVPTEGATERSLATLMVGRDVLLRVEKPDAHAGRAAARGARACPRATTAACPPCATCRFEVRAGEIVGLAGVDANGQSELIETIMGLRKPDAGTITVARPRRHRTPARATTLDAGRRPHRRGPPPARARARVRPRREPLPARVPQPGDVAPRLALAEARWPRARAGC